MSIPGHHCILPQHFPCLSGASQTLSSGLGPILPSGWWALGSSSFSAHLSPPIHREAAPSSPITGQFLPIHLFLGRDGAHANWGRGLQESRDHEAPWVLRTKRQKLSFCTQVSVRSISRTPTIGRSPCREWGGKTNNTEPHLTKATHARDPKGLTEEL